LLRQKDAPLNGKDLESGYSPLHRAAFHGQLRALVFLLGRGANLALADSDGLTVLDHLVLDRPLHVTYERRAPLEAYLWGANSNYNLGLGTNTTRALPDVLDQFRRDGTHLASVCLGKFHSGFVTRSGSALTCGHGRGGRLGHGSETMQLLPGAVQLPGPCAALALGTDHTVFLCEGGAVCTAGMNTYHQLGHTPPPPLLLAPAPCTPRGAKVLLLAS
jgi:alpha-tubulin suppressor-like RCC1 family protein